VNTWECLLSLSSDEIGQMLFTAMRQLEERTGQAFVNVVLDDAHVGARALAGRFRGPGDYRTQELALLDAWVQSLASPIFRDFHFNV
jgi:hypothetical protein